MWSKRGDTTLVFIIFLSVFLASAVYVYSVNETNQTSDNITASINITLNSTQENISDSSVPNQEVSPTPHEELPVQVLQNQTEISVEVTAITVKDSKGKEISAELRKVKKDKERFEIIPSKGSVKNIKFEDLEISSSGSLGIDEVSKTKDKSKKWETLYAIDPSNLNFTNATVTVNAKGSQLYKCKEWDFANQKCNGEWTLLKYVTPGQDYTFTLTKDDPGFGEILAISALHMDANYTVISDIFDEVKTKDNVWSEPINQNEIVRVTFETNLTNGRYIDVFAKANIDSYFEIYETNTNHKVGRSGYITRPELIYVQVDNLTQPTDTFDFIIRKQYPEGNSSNIDPITPAYIEFDYIHDDIITSTTAHGLIAYSELGPRTPRYRLFNDTSKIFGSELSAQSLGAGAVNQTWIVTRCNHERDECLMGTIDRSNDLNIQRFNRTKGWDNLREVAINIPNVNFRSFDIAFEDVSGRALIVYENNTGVTDADVFFRIWNGTGYTAQQTLTLATLTGDYRFISLYPKPRTNEMMVVVSLAGGGATTAYFALPWNGTAFDNSRSVNSSTTNWAVASESFDFAWESLSGEGLLISGSANKAYSRRAYHPQNSSATDWGPLTDIEVPSGVTPRPHSAKVCSDPTSDTIGIIYDYEGAGGGSTAEVGIDIWNGTGLSATQDLTDGFQQGGTDVRSITCAWYPDGSKAVFGFMDDNDNRISFINFTKPTTFQGSLATHGHSVAFATVSGGNGIMNIMFVPHPTTNQIMATTMDIVEDLHAILWNGTTFMNNNTVESTTATVDGAQQSIMFDWNRFDPAPAVTNPKPSGTSHASGSVLEINATVIDNVAVSRVKANVTRPSGAISLLNLSRRGVTNTYNATFTNTNVAGTYTVRFFANDTSTHRNINKTVTATFTIADLTPPAVFAPRPRNGSIFNLSNIVTIAANVTDNVNVSTVRANITFPNGTRQLLTLVADGVIPNGFRFNKTFTIPATVSGVYRIQFVANDTSNNFNRTTRTNFTAVENIKPAVFAVKPPANSIKNVSRKIEIAANVTDNAVVSVVRANITLPNGTLLLRTLSLVLGTTSNGKYNVSFTVPNRTGLYRIQFIANDTSNNINATTMTNFTAQDRDNPSVTAPRPRNGSFFNVSNVVTISANVSDNINVSVVRANITFPNGTLQLLTLVKNGLVPNGARYNATFTVPFTRKGVYRIQFVANDTSNNFNRTTRTNFTAVDNVKPEVKFVRPRNNSFFNVSNVVTISANVSDNINVSVVRANITFPNGTRQLLTLVADGAIPGGFKYNRTFTVPFTRKGLYRIQFIANDSSNTVNATSRTNFTAVDNVKPEVKQVRPRNNSFFNVSQVITISANVTDNVNVSVVRANITFPNGTLQLLTLVRTGTTDKYNKTFTVPFTRKGLYRIQFIANDSSNTVNATSRTNFTAVDNVKPSVRILLPPLSSVFNTNSNVTIRVNVTDNINVSAVFANVTLPNGTIVKKILVLNSTNIYNATFGETSTNGLYTIRVVANDTSNNKNQTQTRTFTIQDANSPVVNLIAPADNTLTRNNNVTFICNATDNVALQNISLYHNIGQAFGRNQTTNVGGTFNLTNFTINNIGDGTFLWNCRAFDTAGNGAFAQSNFTLKIDRTPPAVFAVKPPANSIKNTSTRIEIAANVSDINNVNSVFVNITLPNSTILVRTLTLVSGSTINGKYNISFTVPNRTGLYRVKFVANDTVNNKNKTVTTNFTVVDNLNPEVKFVRPRNNSFFNVSNIVTISANVSDNINVSVVRANITFPNGTRQLLTLVKNGLVPNGARYNATFTVPFTRKGVYRIQFVANDTSNNFNRTTRTNFTAVDNVKPEVKFVRPRNNSFFNVSNVITISANVSDNINVSVVRANITFPNGTLQLLTLVADGAIQGGFKYNRTFTVPFTRKGLYRIQFIANDSSNTVNATSRTNFTAVDNVKPEVKQVRPRNNSIFNLSEIVTISANVTDNVNVSIIRANITFPNNTIQILNLVRTGTTDKYNKTFTIPSTVKGLYRVQFLANDSSNSFNTTTRTNFTARDVVAPVITPQTCVPRDGNLTNSVFCNATVTDAIAISTVRANVSIPGIGTQRQTVSNTTNVYFFTFVNTTKIGRYNVTWFANDSSNNRRAATDFFNISDRIKPSITLNAPKNNFNTSSRTVRFNFTAVDNFATTMNCSLRIDNVITNTTTATNNTPKVVGKGSHSEGNHTWNVACSDPSGNTNTSETRNYKVDVSAPLFVSLNTQPDTTDELDPGINITVLAQVTDNVTGVQTVILQRKLQTESVFTNQTMALNTTSGLFYATFNASTAGTYNLRLFAKDVVNNSATSNTVNRTVQFETTWIRSPSVFDPVVTTPNQNVTLGILNITNTGDVSLNFNITSDSSETLFNDSSNFTLAKDISRLIRVNDTAPAAGVKTVTLNISASPNATPSSRITTGNIVVADQPILLIKFTEPSTDSITKTRGTENIVLTVNITNIGTRNATNVTLFTQFPSGFILTAGIDPRELNEILVNETKTNTIEFRITSDHALGTFTIVSNATGQNFTGGDLQDQGLIFTDSLDVEVVSAVVLQPSGGGAPTPTISAGGGGGGGGVAQVPGTETIFTDEVVTTVRGTAEGIPIKITNFYENSIFENIDLSVLGFFSQYVRIVPLIDYTKEVFVETLNVPLTAINQKINVILGGDIGQHSITLNSITEDSIVFTFLSDPITVTLRVGETKKYDLDGDGTNDVAFTLKDIILGKADLKVHRIGPPDPNILYYLEDRDYIMTIFAPAYLTETDFNLTVKIAADIVAVNPELAGFDVRKLTEYRRFVFKVLEVGREEISVNLEQAENDIKEMEAAGFPTARTRELLRQAKTAVANNEYGEALILVDQISAAKINAFEANLIINEVKAGIENAKLKGLSVPQTENSLNLALKAFEREDFATAVQRAKETQLALILETRGRINIVLFLRDYWWAVLIGAVGSVIIGFVVYRRLEVFFIGLKLKNLDKEEISISALIGEAQKKRLTEGALSGTDYARIIRQYETRLNNIKQHRVILRNKRLLLLESRKGVETLNREQRQIAGLMKKAQEDYFKKGKLTRERFLGIYKSDKEKLAEVQEEKQKLLEKLHKQKLIEKIAKKQERQRKSIEIHEALKKPEVPPKPVLEKPVEKHRFLIARKIKRLFIRDVDEEIEDLTYEIEQKLQKLKKKEEK